jgi:hypothetical protein
MLAEKATNVLTACHDFVAITAPNPKDNFIDMDALYC